MGLLEPVEQVYLEVPNDYLGAVTEMLGQRRAVMQNIRYGDDGTVYCRVSGADARHAWAFASPS